MTTANPKPKLSPLPYYVRCPACKWKKDVRDPQEGRSWSSVHVKASPWRCVLHLVKRWSQGEEIVDIIQVRPVSRLRRSV